MGFRISLRQGATSRFSLYRTCRRSRRQSLRMHITRPTLTLRHNQLRHLRHLANGHQHVGFQQKINRPDLPGRITGIAVISGSEFSKRSLNVFPGVSNVGETQTCARACDQNIYVYPVLSLTSRLQAVHIAGRRIIRSHYISSPFRRAALFITWKRDIFELRREYLADRDHAQTHWRGFSREGHAKPPRHKAGAVRLRAGFT